MLVLRIVEANARAVGRSWVTELLPNLIQPLIFCAVFGGLLRAAAGEVADWGSGPAFSYAQYIIPGIVCTSCAIAAAIDASHLVFIGLKLTKKFETILTTPVSTASLAVGHVLWATAYGASLSAILFCVVAPVLPPHSLPRLPLAVLSTALAAAALAAVLGLIVARSSGSPQVLNVIGRVIVPPLMIFGATVFPLSVLPRPLALALSASPVANSTIATRALLVGLWPDAAAHLAVTLSWLLVATVLLARSLDRELRA